MTTTYPPLSIGAARRLALFKAEAANPNRRWVRPMTWRDVRFADLTSPTGWTSCTELDEPTAYIADGQAAHYFRRIRGEHHGSRSGGYYTDLDCCDVAKPIVAHLSHGRFLAGYEWTSNGETVVLLQSFAAEADAFRCADAMAEQFADQARSDSEKYLEAQKLSDAIDDLMTELCELFALRNHPRFRYARERASGLIGRIRSKREEMELLADYL